MEVRSAYISTHPPFKLQFVGRVLGYGIPVLLRRTPVQKRLANTGHIIKGLEER
jgi:hypothetical protein